MRDLLCFSAASAWWQQSACYTSWSLPQLFLFFQDVWLQPACRDFAPNGLYNFETWGQQLADFIDQVIGEPAFLLCNSVGGEPARQICHHSQPVCTENKPLPWAWSSLHGALVLSRLQWTSNAVHIMARREACPAGIAALQAAKVKPRLVRGVQLQNVSLRMLHSSKQNRFQRPLVRALQNTLRTTSLGQMFFKQVASAKVRPFVRVLFIKLCG